jgi:hypothetical protein
LLGLGLQDFGTDFVGARDHAVDFVGFFFDFFPEAALFVGVLVVVGAWSAAGRHGW